MDVRHSHGSTVHVLRACYHDDAHDLVALGGDHSVEVIQLGESSCRTIATFYVGLRTTAIAWSSRVSSPSSSDRWSIQLAVAASDFSLYLLTKDAGSEESVFRFGSGLSGHHGTVNDMAFCGGQSEDSSRYVASVSDDKFLMVWDLEPSINIASPSSPDGGGTPEGTSERAQPTAYAVAFPHPLTSVDAHPSTSKEVLVGDARGSVFLTDWRTDQEGDEQARWRNQAIVELLEPRALADAAPGLATRWSGSVAWRRDPSADFVGAAYGSRFALWDMGNLHGGKPYLAGPSFPEGGHQFRWCPTYPDYFAVSTRSPARGAAIHVHNVAYPHAPPTVFALARRPLYVRAFDFVACRGIPRIAAAVGRDVVVFYIGVDS
ncbi:WD40-repeat-containing domain protein [Epithele typhae]|uniref:WD40-repeat-containing domain protein n=1 Tax=Epithele typhae TaxID=378194 RepID=UPI002008A53B|nr:WD40-repeat-containing domain protein [Epithele typhae]KAH9946415.1 WD40-repeat-containing domain protein [Epithele typhae]